MRMMAVISYPIGSSPEIGKIFVESLGKPMPEYIIPAGTYTICENGTMKGHIFYEIENGYEDEGLREVIGRMAEFDSVKGFRFDFIDIANEPFPLVGSI
jgi:hypothetical protein